MHILDNDIIQNSIQLFSVNLAINFEHFNMRFLFLLLIILIQPIFSQQKEITLEDIWVKNTFETASLEAFHSMKNGDYYTILNHNSHGTYMDKYDYKTLEKVETLVLGKDLEGIKYFDDYTFSSDEKKVIIGVNLEKIYRRSKIGRYYVYDLTNKILEPISELNIQEPSFSPDGSKIYNVESDFLSDYSSIYQYDLSQTNLLNSKTLVFGLSGDYRLWLAPNHKVYLFEFFSACFDGEISWQ